jgi:hypothetical protein
VIPSVYDEVNRGEFCDARNLWRSKLKVTVHLAFVWFLIVLEQPRLLHRVSGIFWIGKYARCLSRSLANIHGNLAISERFGPGDSFTRFIGRWYALFSRVAHLHFHLFAMMESLRHVILLRIALSSSLSHLSAGSFDSLSVYGHGGLVVDHLYFAMLVSYK